MGTEPGSVLDPQLRVRGVAGLRVTDALALPRIPRANTNALRSWSGSAARTSYSIPVDSFRRVSVRVASRQDAREGGFVASCDCARLGTRARVAGWDLLVVIL
jgi:hypothetical protein